MSEKTTLKEFVTGKLGPRWLAGVAGVALLGQTLLPLYQQADEIFEFSGPSTALREARRHFDEMPIEASVMVEGLGIVTLQYFPSDRCTRIFLPDTDIAKWVTYDDMTAGNNGGSLLRFMPELLAAAPQGRCMPAESHRDDPAMTPIERDEDMVLVGMEFDDGCAGQVWCHASGEWCATDKEGRLLISWDECVH